MAEIYVIANLDKKQFISPSELGDGAKLPEFAGREDSPSMVALALLLSKNPQFPGSGAKSVGRPSGAWYGDRIAFVGSWEDRLPGREENLYELITGQYKSASSMTREYTNISSEMLEMVHAYIASYKPPYRS